MATIKTNKAIPLLVFGFLCMTVVVMFKASVVGGDDKKQIVAEAGSYMSRVPTPRSLDADTPIDTIRAIQGQVTASNVKRDETMEINTQLIADLDRVIDEKTEIEVSAERHIEERLNSQAEVRSKAQQRQFDEMMAKMAGVLTKMADASQTPSTHPGSNNDNSATWAEAPTAVMIPEGFGVDIEAGQFVSGEELIEVFWIEPLDESINNRVDGGLSYGSLADRAQSAIAEAPEGAKAVLMRPLETYREVIDNIAETRGVIKGRSISRRRVRIKSDRQSSIQPIRSVQPTIVEVPARYLAAKKRQSTRVYEPNAERRYTIPDLSVLGGARATTSLVGRIYPDGNIVDPQFFKLLVGRENFTANFNSLPTEIEGMIFEGYGIGDFTTRCVSGKIVAATFIFEDGTTKSVYPGDPGSRPNSTGEGASMGYITDPYGNPCVHGKLITDAKEYFATGGMLAFAGAYAGALREGQQTVTEGPRTEEGFAGARTTTVTGSAGRYAFATGVGAGIDRGIQWVDEMYKASRSVIYAPSGMYVDIHLQQEIQLDIGPNQRKIRYRKNANNRSDLD